MSQEGGQKANCFSSFAIDICNSNPTRSEVIESLSNCVLRVASILMW